MIFAANFKTNHTRSSTASYLQQLDSFMQFQPEESRCMVFPPLTALDSFGLKRVEVGVQNAYPMQKGSMTGEVGSEQLEEFGVGSIILGHSERRHKLGETQELIAQKYEYFKEREFTIVYCIGEPLEVRKSGDLKEYLGSQLENIDLAYERLIIAYEPVWAIGTGESADRETIAQTHDMLRQMVGSVPLLYGGSVKPDGIQEITGIENVEGVLVGSASLDVKSFEAIISNAQA